MDKTSIRWLYEELPELVRRGVLDEAAAGRLREHYGPPPESRAHRVLLAIFGVLGTVLIGAGIALVLAHNWEQLTRPVRAGISFGLLLAAQGIVAVVLLRRRESAAWTEASSGALALAVVGAMALISQTYHMGGDIRTLLFTWALLVVPLPYVTGSRLVAAGVWGIGAWWLMAGVPRDDAAVYGWLIPVAATVPFLVVLGRRHRGEPRTALVGWSIAITSSFALPRIADTGGHGLWIPVLAGFFGVLLVLGLEGERHGASAWSWSLRPWTTSGTVGLGFLIFLFGFREVWRPGDATDLPGDLGPVGFGVRAGAALALVAASGYGAFRLARRRRRMAAVLASTPVWAAAGWVSALSVPESVNVTASVAHLAALGIGIAACVEGLREGSLGKANGGLLLIAAVAVARFFDADIPFVVRGVAFILVGTGFLAINARLLRRRRVAP